MVERQDERRAKAAAGSDLRDIVGAWLLCALVAAMALALSGELHPAASAATATALMQISG